MKVFGFTIAIDEFVDNLDAIDVFYGKTADASVAASEGKTLIHFDREAESLDAALRSAVADVQDAGWQVCEITIQPDCLLPVSTR
jgi:hypothetical protein